MWRIMWGRGFVDFFLIYKLHHHYQRYTDRHTTVFLEQASPVKNVEKCQSDHRQPKGKIFETYPKERTWSLNHLMKITLMLTLTFKLILDCSFPRSLTILRKPRNRHFILKQAIELSQGIVDKSGLLSNFLILYCRGSLHSKKLKEP